MPSGNVTASEVVAPIEARLRSHLPRFLDDDLSMPEDHEWFRLPSVSALRTAVTPSIALVVDGLSEPPTFDRVRGYSATWDVTIAAYLRGVDWNDTRSRVERYVGALRGCVLSAPDGIARRWAWDGEQYDQVDDAGSARTLGAGYLLLRCTVPGALVPARLVEDDPGVFTEAITTVRPARARGYVDDLTHHE